jgi:hypothetical protein
MEKRSFTNLIISIMLKLKRKKIKGVMDLEVVVWTRLMKNE